MSGLTIGKPNKLEEGQIVRLLIFDSNSQLYSTLLGRVDFVFPKAMLLDPNDDMGQISPSWGCESDGIAFSIDNVTAWKDKEGGEKS